MSELVNHPNHYNKAGRPECIEEMKHKFGTEAVWVFCMTSAYKYLYRAGCKDGNSKEQDLAKADWYINFANTDEELRVRLSYFKIKYVSLYNEVIKCRGDFDD